MDLTKDPIPVLIRRLAVPASVGFFFNTMYNVVDTYFGGQVSTEALAALSMSFPVFFILLAVGAGISQGSTALIANSLGSSDSEGAGRFAKQAVTLGVMVAIALSFVGWFATPFLFRELGAEGSGLEVATRYMRVVLIGTVFFFTQSVLNSTLNAQGDTKTFRNVLIVGFVLNICLDPWFLYGGLGLPAMGMRGIALATVVIQALGCVYLFIAVRKTPVWANFQFRELKPDAKTIGAILEQGAPAALNMMSVALGIFIITWFVGRFGQEGVAAYGVATRVEQIILLPTIGLNIAVLSLVGQNNGAGRLDRVRAAWFLSMRYGLIMMGVGGALLGWVRGPMMRFFTTDAQVIALGREYLGVASLTLCAYVFLFQTVFMLQGIKRPMYGLWLGLYRQIVAPLIVFHFLANVIGMRESGVWWGVFGVTWSAAIFSFFYGRHVLLRRTAAVSPGRETDRGAPGARPA